MAFTTLYSHARIATMADYADRLGLIEDGAICVRGDRIVYVGPIADIGSDLSVEVEVDCRGRLITPGLIDCHTHIVHGGERSAEFEMRLAGASYEEIARAGGGIVSTVSATRATIEDALLSSAVLRLDRLLAEGVTTVEVKSGYGLNLETEARMLRVARQLERERPISVKTSFLGAHALPPEAAGDRDRYIADVAGGMLPALAADGLVDAVDAFCETIAFSPEQVTRVFSAAAALGLPVKLHADQLSDLGGAAMAAQHRALSADHLEYSSLEGAAALGRAGTVAVLLPGAYYFLREPKAPPVDAFRRHGVRMAVATDCNPGTSPLTSLLTAMNMAATLFRLTVDECLAGVTREAAQALGVAADVGTIEIGKLADLAIWDVERPAELVCRIGADPLHARIWHGDSEGLS